MLISPYLDREDKPAALWQIRHCDKAIEYPAFIWIDRAGFVAALPAS
jgi:hypothetical protein